MEGRKGGRWGCYVQVPSPRVVQSGPDGLCVFVQDKGTRPQGPCTPVGVHSVVNKVGIDIGYPSRVTVSYLVRPLTTHYYWGLFSLPLTSVHLSHPS